ncbi:carbohydrate ABC transporter permease [Neobacillus mesonae]|uniref:carbohydrate ABC transporter permease n=1 Tax=Neobacillus mesonae TaxID=1193713 RepID=UPI002E1B8B87
MIEPSIQTSIKLKNKAKTKRLLPVGKTFSTLVLIFFAILFLFPFYWVITGAFKLQIVATTIPPEWFPLKPTMQNWVDLFKNPVGRWTFNSFFISFSEMVLICITASLAGYVLAKKRFPGRNLIFWMFIAAMALPKQVILVPLFTMLADMGWVDTYQGLIFPAVGWPFGVFLMKQFAQTIPDELIEAAKMDGCSEFRIFTSIILPMLKPAIGALAIFTFIASWNDYFMQLIMTRSSEMQTLPLGVAAMQSEFTTNYGVLMAGAALSSIPMIAIFLAFQKYFTQGITMGAVKG